MMNEQAERLLERLRDKWWRMNNLYQVLDEDGKVVPFKLRDEQRSFYNNRHARNFVPKSRKLGMSTLIVLDYLDECIWTRNRHVAHVDFREDDAKKKLGIARLAWNEGPNHPNPAISQIWQRLHQKLKLVKDNGSELAWSNGSKQEAGMSFMGGTPHRLHISEFGPMAAQRPEAAQKVKRGSFNALAPGGILDVETTMEGGKFGECYALFELAVEARKAGTLTALDWRIHFFPWYNHPRYILPGGRPSKEQTVKYFKEMHDRYGIDIPLERQAWYERKSAEQGEDMFTQFPTVEEECVMTKVAGAIYPGITTLRARGRVTRFEPERGPPIFSAWDLGVSDYTAGWIIQPVGRELNWLAWFEGEGIGAAEVVNVIHEWEGYCGKRFQTNFFPHDANIREKSNKKTYVDALKVAGLASTSIRVVPRTPDRWIGINALRDLLPNSWFHLRTDVPRLSADGTKLPSGLQCLEGYRKQPPTPGGVLREEPLHDHTSHTADAARTFAEAWSRGLVDTHSSSSWRPNTKVLS